MSSIDIKLETNAIQDLLQELVCLMKNNIISAAYKPNKQITSDFAYFAQSLVTQWLICMQMNTSKNKTEINHSNEISIEITVKAIEDVLKDSYDRNQNRYRPDYRPRPITTTQTIADKTLFVLDLRTKTSEIAQIALGIEINAIATDPTIVTPRTVGNIQGNDHMIGMTPKQDIVS